MNELERLVLTVEKRAKKSLNNFIDFSQDSLEAKLYQLVKDKLVENDAAALEALYGSAADPKRYKMLKSRLKKKLYAIVDTIVLKDTLLKPYLFEEQQCQNLINRAYILYQVEETVLALKVISQAISIAEEYKMAALLLRCYELKYAMLYERNQNDAFFACEHELEKYRHIRNLELDSLIIYRKARFGLKQAVAGRNEALNQLPTAIKLLEKKWKESNSPLIYEYLHILRMQYYEFIGNYKQLIQSADSTEKFIAEGVIPKNRFDLRYNKFIKVFAFLQLREYTVGLAYAQDIESEFLFGSKNWSAFMENYFLLALQSKDYQLAAGLLQKFAASDAIYTINNPAKERWALYITFYNLITGEKFCPEKALRKKTESLLKLTIRDKEGFNVSIVILEIFELLKQPDKWEDTSHYSDRIRKYIQKYLTKKEAERPRLFFKLVLLMFRENLDASACRKKSRYLLQKLKNTPLPGDAFAEVEIVPYEQLWELALSLMVKAERNSLQS
ncbi:hypothetical protein [Botryobacter ruber]|uniref:hypothetical protein n=1 Tax=Botryobacter ruber TaxID=2171629 RepID=UPI000E0B126E|nr:hypothetical protein [Botryobacter ruber]